MAAYIHQKGKAVLPSSSILAFLCKDCHNKAKIERWFRTMKDQWMSSLDIRAFHSLDELRGSLLSYVQSYNQTVHSSLKGESPQDRFFSEPDHIRRLSDEEIDTAFLLEIERRVSSDSVIVINQIEYEVDCRFAKQRIKLRYSPNMKVSSMRLMVSPECSINTAMPVC